MQPTDEDKLVKFDSFFKGFDLQAALAKQPPLNWEDLFTPPDPKPDVNVNSDEEPVIEAWMKPIYDLMMKEQSQKNVMDAAKKSGKITK